jgi:hypothetical protein
MAQSDPEEGFKVTDRRRRDDNPAPSAITSEPPSAAPPRAEPREPTRPPAPEPAGTVPSSERNLIGLFMMLGSSALVALGEAVEPGMGQPRPNPQEAAALVDLLVLLREKTEGHRTPEENDVIGELIYDLQLRYINLTKRLAKPRG